MEQWKKFYTYEISNTGKIRNAERHIMAQTTSKKGYKKITLKVDGKLTGFRIHRLVAKAFIPLDPDRDQVNHKDGDKSNNNSDNLEWCTNRENYLHAVANNLRYRKTATDDIVKDRIAYFAKNNITTKEYALKFGINADTLKDQINGRTYSHLSRPWSDIGIVAWRVKYFT